MKSNKSVHRFQVIFGFIMFILLFFEKIYVNGRSYSIMSFPAALIMGEIRITGPEDLVSIFSILISAVIMSLYLVRSILLLKKKNAGILTVLHGPAFGIFALGLLLAQFIMLINAFLVAIEYMGTRWMKERDAINAAYEGQKAIEKTEKERMKRIRHFPGRYPAEFYQIIRKNDTYERKGRMILILGCFFTAACLYIMLTMYGLVTQVQTNASFLGDSGLGRLFMQTGLVVGLFAVLMMTMITSYYIKDRKELNRLFIILGMRSRTVYLMFTLLFGAAVFIAGVLGIVAGMFISYIIRDVW